MNDIPLVSILMPAYNAERYIKESIDSALAQTYKNIEVVVIDAASKDRTVAIVGEYTDPRVRLIEHPYEPIIATRNGLLKEARGEYIAFLDSDDIYLPDRIAEEVKFFEENPRYSIVYCDLSYFYDGAADVLYRNAYPFRSDNAFLQLLDKMYITNTTVMFKREIYEKLGGYNESLGLVEDWEYFLRIAHAGYEIPFLNKDLVRYRLRWDSHTNFARQVAIKESAVKIFENLKEHMTEDEREKYDIDRHIAKQKENLIITLFSAGRKKEAMQIYAGIRSYISPKRRMVIMAMLPVPTPILRFLIERAWNYRKRHLFIRVG
ncbi:MAG TPA: glycosyltransferase [Candidatus Paceibacterota bacterium]|nr:glycosyltransferase [Candidatus Paceibacterota bacterium]